MQLSAVTEVKNSLNQLQERQEVTSSYWMGRLVRYLFCLIGFGTREPKADSLADELRTATLSMIEQKVKGSELFLRVSQACLNRPKMASTRSQERIRLYRYMAEMDHTFPKTACEQDSATKRHHFLLRMAKSLSTLDKKEFIGLKPFVGLAMIIEDLDAYLERHPDCPAAKKAKERLLHCRSLTLQGALAEQLAREEKNPHYLDIYYDDLANEIANLAPDEELVLLGGSHDHAILHCVQKGATLLKTINSGLGITKHAVSASNRFQTHTLSNLTKKHFSKEVIKSLFAAKLVDVSKKDEETKKHLSNKQIDAIYQQLKALGNKKPARSNTSQHAYRMQMHSTCLRNIFLIWLKQELFKESYSAFKIPFSQKALTSTTDPELLQLGQKKLARRKAKAQSLAE